MLSSQKNNLNLELCTLRRLTAESSWRNGDRVTGLYCGVAFSGCLSDRSRPTPDFKNVIFSVVLDSAIVVFGSSRERIEITTNSEDWIFLVTPCEMK